MRRLLYILPLMLFISCIQNDAEIDSVEKRVQAAIDGLMEELNGLTTGWKVVYQPTERSGGFLMLLDFDENGQVRVRTDVAANDGEFFDHTMSYRVDNSLQLELIFETYGIFHYLFELDQTTFGAEFEFYFEEKDEDGNLIFTSKTDGGNNPTIFTLTPASPTDQALLATSISTNLDKFKDLTPQIFGAEPPIQQVYLNGSNISFFWSINLDKRIVDVDFAGVGNTFEEIYGNGTGVSLNFSSGYSFSGDQLILQEPLTMSVNGSDVTITSLSFTTFDESGGGSLCPVSSDVTPIYSGTATGNGNFTASQTLFDRSGETFTANDQGLYAVNIPFIFNDSLQSLSDEGVIKEQIPNAVAFIMTYGFNSTTIPAYSIGFITEDNDSTDIILREFEPTTSIGNQVNIVFKDDYYQSDGIMTSQDSASMVAVTETIFSGGQVYAFDYPIQGLQIYRLFNPCNRFEIFVVQ
ncbi:MAG: DUF4302 domain-containing protein [Bacteroidota bacterium]